MRVASSCSLALFALSAFLAGCGPGASVAGGPNPQPTASPVPSSTATAAESSTPRASALPSPVPTGTQPSASATPTASATFTPTPTAAATASPTASPTATGYTLSGVTTCTAPDEAIPGTYTTLDTNGNVVGDTYTEDTTAINSYLVYSYASAPPTAAPTPTQSPAPTPVPDPTGTPEKISLYIGEYSVPAFVGLLLPTVYDAQATSGCFMLALEQPGSGNAGQNRRRNAAGGDNAFGIGELANPGYTYTKTDVDAEALNALTITNLTPTSGSGTFALSNGTNGTLTITGSGTIVVTPNATDVRERVRSLVRSLSALGRL